MPAPIYAPGDAALKMSGERRGPPGPGRFSTLPPDREPPRLAAVPTAHGGSGFPSTLAGSYALRAGMARGPSPPDALNPWWQCGEAPARRSPPSLDTAHGGVVRCRVMRTQSPDTSPEAERVLLDLLRSAPAWRKLRMVEDTNRSVKDLLMTGLRERFPQDPPLVLRRRLADLWLGPELSAAVYGPAPKPS